jgi:NADH-quinone oxidoreductase subunit L
MPDFFAPIQHVTIAGTLWLLVATPLLAAAYSAWVALFGQGGQGGRARAIDARGRQAVATLSCGAMGIDFALAIYHAVLLARRAPDDRFLLQHLWRMVRVGQLDASMDLAFDPLSATMVLVVTGVGLLIFVYAAAYMEKEPGYARFFAWLNGFVVAMLVVVLADNFVFLFMGWEGVGLASWGLIGFWWTSGEKASAGRKAFVVNRVGDVGLVLGVALLYWGLGGSWMDGDYVPDLNARFASVQVGVRTAEAPQARAEPASAPSPEDEDEADPELAPGADSTRAPDLPSTRGDGYLTLTSYSGAVVFMDDARTPLFESPGRFLRAPFARFAVRGGLHSFRIHPGDGSDDFLVTHVAFGEGREVALVPFGPSVTFRNVRDQLAARDAHGHAPARDALLLKRGWGAGTFLTLACICLFLGAVGKSAQFPLFVWLPDAMAGPTPVSALIHAATMVTAGVYLVARLGFVFVLSPVACTTVAVVGVGTALFAGTMGLYQYDLKRILAYSTVSQLGMMMLAVGVGAYSAGIFHLVTHACFKACLFLCAGAVVHALHRDGESARSADRSTPDAMHDSQAAQDIRQLGGLKRVLPKTARAYFVACLAITAAPIPGLAGFWSKDDILASAVTAENLVKVPGPALAAVALLVAGTTSYSIWRSWYVVFEGEPTPRTAKLEEHASPMTAVLTWLAGLSALAGLLGVSARLVGGTGESLLEAWLAPVFGEPAAPFAPRGAAVEWGVIVAAYAVATGGWALARARYGVGRRADWEAAERKEPLFAASTHGWWVDAFYTRTVVALTRGSAVFLAAFDGRVIDGAVNAAGIATRVTAWLVGRADDAVVDGAVRGLSVATLRASERLRRGETGRLQLYVYVLAVGAIALAFAQYWLR